MSRNDLMIFALGMVGAAGGVVAIATFLQFGREVRRTRKAARRHGTPPEALVRRPPLRRPSSAP